jgi:predicted outer membrane repeat protein
MFPTAPARHVWRVASLLSAALLFACSDASGPDARLMPTTPNAQLAPPVIVTNTDDAGPGSLRQAILDAVDGDVIQFDASIAGQTIALTTGELRVDKILTIEGPVASGMTISGSFLSRVFYVDSVLTARNLSIVNGRAPTGGGGIVVIGRAILDHVLVANNEATDDGGGIYVLGSNYSELTLLNSTVTGNTASFGGGITANSTVTIRNSTISQNTAKDVGGIHAHKTTLHIRNSIVAGNVDTEAAAVENCYIEGTSAFVPAGANLSDDASCGAGFSIGDPRLGPLANNGGPTHTQALLFGSPAIDLGTSCTEATDQRYVTRPQGSSCDVGAFEFDAYRNISLTISPNVAVNAKTGVATVTGTLSCPGQAYSPLSVTLSQTQKTTGKFTTIIQAQANIPAATCTSTPSSWSVALTPATGKFSPGAATGSASVTSAPGGYVPASVASPLKLFQVK